MPVIQSSQIERDVAQWLERLLGTPTVDSSAPLLPQLASGVALWRLLAAIVPGQHAAAAATVAAATQTRGATRAPGDYRARDAVAKFLAACSGLVRRSALFEVRARPSPPLPSPPLPAPARPALPPPRPSPPRPFLPLPALSCPAPPQRVETHSPR